MGIYGHSFDTFIETRLQFEIDNFNLLIENSGLEVIIESKGIEFIKTKIKQFFDWCKRVINKIKLSLTSIELKKGNIFFSTLKKEFGNLNQNDIESIFSENSLLENNFSSVEELKLYDFNYNKINYSLLNSIVSLNDVYSALQDFSNFENEKVSDSNIEIINKFNNIKLISREESHPESYVQKRKMEEFIDEGFFMEQNIEYLKNVCIKLGSTIDKLETEFNKINSSTDNKKYEYISSNIKYLKDIHNTVLNLVTKSKVVYNHYIKVAQKYMDRIKRYKSKMIKGTDK